MPSEGQSVSQSVSQTVSSFCQKHYFCMNCAWLLLRATEMSKLHWILFQKALRTLQWVCVTAGVHCIRRDASSLVK